MRKLAAAVLLCVVTLALLAGPGIARLETAEMTTAAVIGDAYSKGTISHDEMILQMAYALCAPWKVREDLVGVQIDMCGTPMDDMIRLALPDLPDAVAEEIRGLRARPSTMTYIETTHFRIHYDTSGTHMIYGWPSTAYRDAMMVEVEHIWDEEVTNMGFRAPPPDGGDPDGGGGNDLYDIYVQNGSLGACYGSYSYNDGPGGYPPFAWTTYVLIENDWVEHPENSPIEWMQIVMAHEFGHACQAAHNINADTWYKECTSVWLADTLYDDVNHYRTRLSPFLSTLYQSIDYHEVGTQRWYGSCVWNFFLSENFGNQIVVDNWWQIQHNWPALEMINIVLGTYGSSMEEAYKEFAIWCWFTGSRDDGNHFEEGAYWPTASVMRGHNSYPIASGGPTPGWEPDRYGCNYITFNYPGSGHSRLLVSYDGPSLLSVGNAAYLNYRTSGGVFGEYGEIPLSPWGNGELAFDGWDTMQYVGLVVANCDGATNDMNYSYNAEEPDTTGIGDESYAFGLKAASPNPFAETTSIAYSVPTGGGLVDIVIYDVNGREICSLVRERMNGGAGVAVWDGLDNAGESVASGVYFARLDIDGLTASGKLIMLK